MTSEFDSLMYICECAREDPKFEPIALWLANICVKLASSHTPEWTYEKWLKDEDNRDRTLTFFGEEKWQPFQFLDDTHDRLDHTEQFHGKVFGRAGWYLIDVVRKAVEGKEWILGTTYVKNYLRELDKHLRQLGYVRVGSFEWEKAGER